jgi:hypothetical protein
LDFHLIFEIILFCSGSDAGYHPTQQATVYQPTLSAHPTQVSAGTIRGIAPTAPPTPPQQDTGTRLPQQPQTMVNN